MPRSAIDKKKVSRGEFAVPLASRAPVWADCDHFLSLGDAHSAIFHEIEHRFGRGSDLRLVQIMELKDEREVEVTREKLRSLEARDEAVSLDPGDDSHRQELNPQVAQTPDEPDERGHRPLRGSPLPATRPFILDC